MAPLRERVTVLLDGEPAERLVQVQFIVANQGVRAIQPIKPLSLSLPSSVGLLDAHVLHVHPDGRHVGLLVSRQDDGATTIAFPFDVLNRDEGFVVRLLLTGELAARDLRFTLTCDDLPPVVAPTGWGTSRYGITPPFNIGALILMAIFALPGAALTYVAGELARARPWSMPVPWSQFRPSLETLAIACTFALGCGLLLLGVISSVAQEGRPFFNAVRPNLPLPAHLRLPPWITPDMHGRYPLSHDDEQRNNRLV